MACAPTCAFSLLSCSFFLSTIAKFKLVYDPQTQLPSVDILQYLSQDMSRSKELTAGSHPGHVVPILYGTANTHV